MFYGLESCVFVEVDDLCITMLQDEVIFPASNAGIVDLPEGRLPRSYRQ